MDSNSGQTTSLWMATAQMPALSPLTEDRQADMCIIGAGIAGLTTAYLLTREGKSVVVLEDGAIGSGMTQRTTAHLSNAVDDRYFEIERMHGAQGARIAAESHTEAIRRIETIIEEEGIDCDFERLDGYLFVPPGESSDVLEPELEAAHRAGLVDVQWVRRAPMDSFDTGPCLRFPRQAQFHPLKYLTGLARAIEQGGGRLCTQTHADNMEVGTRVQVKTGTGYTVTADAVVIATNSPINDIVTMHTKQAPYATYVIGGRVPRGSITKALYWDTLDPYHYVRLQRVSPPEGGDYDVLIVGGEDHKTGQADDADGRLARLEAWARERFPTMQEVLYRWSGQVMEPADGVAFIGRNPTGPQNVFIVTGDSGMGLTHGTIGGILITDLILGRESPWASLYDPSRKSHRAPLEFVRENLNVAAQFLGDYLTGGDVDSADKIAPGEGAVMRHGLSKRAVYRDEQGTLHELSAVCRHLGCIVRWNSLEKTWDCPCHGSRYDRYGHVVNGPANGDLTVVAELQEVGHRE
jgi:glycine/D-amino acid oxidase-like deaminating enzyme/nitrite reductase/ring-hydroxylating ferredoxin subunit